MRGSHEPHQTRKARSAQKGARQLWQILATTESLREEQQPSQGCAKLFGI
jgi:hypothetical protein